MSSQTVDGTRTRSRHSHRAAGRAAAASRVASRGRRKALLVFLGPFGVVFLAMFVAPIGYAIYESFFKVERDGLGFGPATTVFAGFEHYGRVVHDQEFLRSIGRVILLGAVQVPVMLGLALLLALLLDSRSARLGSFFRLVYFLPFALPGVIAAILWSFLYTPEVSPITDLFGMQVHYTAPGMLMWSIANIITWGWTGYNMLIIYSGLKAIPSELYEAARIDGASAWRIAWHVKVPLVRPALLLTAVFSIIGTLQLYTEPEILRRIGAPVGGHYTPIMVAKEAAFGSSDYHYSAAASVFLAVLTFALSFGFLKFTQRNQA